MNDKNKIQFLKNKLRKANHEVQCLKTYIDAAEMRYSLAGLTFKEEKKIYNLCVKRDFDKLQTCLMEVLSPRVWLSKKEFAELIKGND